MVTLAVDCADWQWFSAVLAFGFLLVFLKSFVNVAISDYFEVCLCIDSIFQIVISMFSEFAATVRCILGTLMAVVQLFPSQALDDFAVVSPAILRQGTASFTAHLFW